MENKLNIKNLKFKEGNKRSLAMALKPVLAEAGNETPEQTAWKIARSLGENFTVKDVEAHLKAVDLSAKTICINESARQLLSEGKAVSDIARTLGKSYQRIKNIEKRMKKKADNNDTPRTASLQS